MHIQFKNKFNHIWKKNKQKWVRNVKTGATTFDCHWKSMDYNVVGVQCA